MPTSYRVYFRGPWGGIVGREEFDAADDAMAIEVARSVWTACSDACHSFDWWQGGRRLEIVLKAPPSAAEISGAAQEMVAHVEERLLDSHWAIVKSQRLLDQARRQRSAG